MGYGLRVMGFAILAVISAERYLRIKDSCIIQLMAQGPSRTCDESKEEGYGCGLWVEG